LSGLAFVSGIACVFLLTHLLNGNHEPIALPKTLDQIIQVDHYVVPIEIPQKTVVPELPKPTEPTDQASWTNPEIVHTSQASPSEPALNTAVSAPTGPTGFAPTEPGTGSSTSSSPAVALPDTTIRNTLELDKQPEFPGGIQKFYQFIGRNYKNPDLDDAQVYRVMVSFVIEKDGSMSNIRVLRDPGYGMGQEALRVLESLQTKWEPGRMSGQKVRTSYTLPIVVKIL